MTDDMRFDGRVAIVTGAGNGLGREYALYLANRGASVIVNDLGTSASGIGSSAEPARRVADEILAAGGIAHPIAQTVATQAGAEAIVAEAVQAFGRIDILINNAGIVRPGGLAIADDEDYLAHLNVSLFGTIALSRLCWPQLKAARGNIVNVSSSSIFGQRDLPAYAAAKGAVWAFSRCIALEGADDGIRVNTLFPMGATRTADASGSAVPDSAVRRFVEQGLVASRNSAMMAYLAHASCAVTGRAFATGSDRAALVFIGEAIGLTKEGLTPEDIAASLGTITDRTDAHDFASFDDYIGFMQRSWEAR